MLNIRTIGESDKAVYNSVVSHPLQSWQWGKFRQKLGQKVARFGVFEKDRLTQGFQVTFHQLPRLSYTVGYLPKSPIPSDEVINYLIRLGKENGSIFIKLEPNVIQSKDTRYYIQNTKYNLVPGKSLFTKYNSLIDLSRSEEEILTNLKPKTRYNIKVAQKHGVIIKQDDSPKAFEAYIRLLFETSKRQGFYAHDEKFHRLQWEIMQPAGISHLLTATHQGKILAAHLFFIFNDILYYPYGSSTREDKAVMAPTLLMWEAIKFGKKMGCTLFDLWGDIEPNPPTNHPYFGFHRFKEGFSPKLVEYIGTYDLVINPNLYKLYNLADKLRWTLLRLRVRF